MNDSTDDKFPIMNFNLDEIDIRSERSKYPFDKLEVGQGFPVEKPVSSISSRVSSENKKGDKLYITRTDKKSTKEKPLTNIIRVK